MRLVTGAARSTSCEALRHWLGIHSIRNRQTILGAKEILRIANTSNHPLYEEIVNRQDEANPQRLTTVKSWVKYSREDVEEICPIENIKSDDWVCSTLFETDQFNARAIGSRDWRERAGVINNSLIREFLEQEAPTIIIATDGSIRGDITAWAGSIWKNGKSVFEWSTGRHGKSSSYRSECEAMEDALVWLTGNSNKDDVVIILTDSYSLVRKLQSGRVKKEWLQLLRDIKAVTSIIYIPGHAGIFYNEVADHLAGNAVAFGNLKLTVADVVSKIETNCLENRNAYKGWSLERLKDKGVERGDGGRVYLRGERRKIATQLKTGVFTRYGLKLLLDLLEGEGPRYLPESLLL